MKITHQSYDCKTGEHRVWEADAEPHVRLPEEVAIQEKAEHEARAAKAEKIKALSNHPDPAIAFLAGELRKLLGD